MTTIKLYETIDEIADYLEAKGIPLPDEYKRRDPKEPGRAIKEQWEDKLYNLMMRYFGGQRKRLAAHLADRLAIRKLMVKAEIDDIMSSIPESVWRDDEIDAMLLRFFIAAGEDGVDLFRQSINIGIDWTQANTQAARWAREYTPYFVDLIDTTTISRLREAVQGFIEIPGATINDVVNFLPFDKERGLRIAVTEITKVFAEAEQIAGLQLRREYPDVQVVKQWFTNQDDRVCEICGPLGDLPPIPVDATFDSLAGELLGPPAHIQCRCWISTRTVI